MPGNIVLKPAEANRIPIDLSYITGTNWSRFADANYSNDTGVNVPRTYPLGMFSVTDDVACIIKQTSYTASGTTLRYRCHYYITLRQINNSTGQFYAEIADIEVPFTGIVNHPTWGVHRTVKWADFWRVGTDKLVVIAHVPISWADGSSHVNAVDGYEPTFKRIRYVYTITDTAVTLESTTDNYNPSVPEWLDFHEYDLASNVAAYTNRHTVKINDYKYLTAIKDRWAGTDLTYHFKLVEFSQDGNATLVGASDASFTLDGTTPGEWEQVTSRLKLRCFDMIDSNNVLMSWYTNSAATHSVDGQVQYSHKFKFDISNSNAVNMTHAEQYRMANNGRIDQDLTFGAVGFTYPVSPTLGYPLDFANRNGWIYHKGENKIYSGSRAMEFFATFDGSDFVYSTIIDPGQSGNPNEDTEEAAQTLYYPVTFDYDATSLYSFVMVNFTYISTQYADLWDFDIVDFHAEDTFGAPVKSSGPLGGTTTQAVKNFDLGNSSALSEGFSQVNSIYAGAPEWCVLGNKIVHPMFFSTSSTTWYFGVLFYQPS